MLNWLFSEPEVQVDIQVDKEFLQNLSSYVKKEESTDHLNQAVSQQAAVAPQPIVLSKEEKNEEELNTMKMSLAEISNNQIGKNLLED